MRNVRFQDRAGPARRGIERCLLIFGLVWWTLLMAPGAYAQQESPARPPTDRLVVGVIERVIVFPGNLPLHAKVDTGARTSSLNAQNIITFRRAGARFVRFSVTNREGRRVEFERRVVRRVRIKEIGRPSLRRPVIRLGLCLGDVYRLTDVTLADRSNFNYQILVGRRFMSQRIIVDPSREYTTEPSCPQVEKRAESGKENPK